MTDILEKLESLEDQIRILRDDLRAMQDLMGEFDRELKTIRMGDDP